MREWDVDVIRNHVCDWVVEHFMIRRRLLIVDGSAIRFRGSPTSRDYLRTRMHAACRGKRLRLCGEPIQGWRHGDLSATDDELYVHRAIR
jgi:hypothetical protein